MTSSTQEHSVVATYDSHRSAEHAIATLQKAGVDMERLSIVGSGFHTEEHALGFYTTGDRIRHWGGNGAFLGSLWGVLFGTGFFFLPAVGPIVVMGPLVALIASALEGAVVGASAGALAAALSSIGVPNDSVIKYELEIKAGRYLVLASGTADSVDRARAILGATDALNVATHTVQPPTEGAAVAAGAAVA